MPISSSLVESKQFNSIVYNNSISQNKQKIIRLVYYTSLATDVPEIYNKTPVNIMEVYNNGEGSKSGYSTRLALDLNGNNFGNFF